MMKSKKLASKILLAVLLAAPYGVANAEDSQVLYEYSTNQDINITVPQSRGYVLNFKDNSGNIIDVADFTVLATGSVNLTGDNNNFTVNAAEGRVGLGIEAKAGSTVVIGNENSNTIMNITSDQWIMGIRAAGYDKDTQGASVTINGKNFVLNATSTGTDSDATVYGLYAQNFTTEAEEAKRAKLVVNAENTVINVKSGYEGAASGLVVMSQGIMEINSNLEVTADNAIVARGGSILKVNENGDKFTKLNGDIDFNYDESSHTKVDADVTIKLSGADSYWNGNSKISWNYKSTKKPDESKLTVDSLKLTLEDGAQWNPGSVATENDEYYDGDTKYVNGQVYTALNGLTSNGGIINLEKMGNQTLEVENLSGESLTVNVANADNAMAITANNIQTLTVAATEEYSAKLAQNDIAVSLQNLADQVTSGGESAADVVSLAETTVTGAATAMVDEYGNVILSSVTEAPNTTNQAISNMAGLAYMAWRAENNDMNKRLGELRDSKGEHGIWARMVRGESDYRSIDYQYNTYQLGYDEKLSTNDKWTVGGAITYTDGDGGFNGGSAETKHTGFALYGSYLNDDGSFIDLIAKYARLEHDYDVTGGAGSGGYDTNGYSVSAEYGKRFTQDNGFWIEPQVELTYGKVGSADYMTENGVKVRQDGMDSLVGRLGFAMGKNFKQGNAYVRASYLYDFDGETTTTFSNSAATRSFEDDLGGGWWEVGVGTNINLSDATHLYFDVEKTYGGDVATPWQWNLGVRYSF